LDSEARKICNATAPTMNLTPIAGLAWNASFTFSLWKTFSDATFMLCRNCV